MFTRLGEFTVRRRRAILVASLLFVVASAVLGTGAFGVLRGGGFEDPDSESHLAEEILTEEFGQIDADAVIVVTPAGGDVDASGVAATIAPMLAEIAATPDVGGVSDYWSLGSPAPLASLDGEHALVLVSVAPGLDEDGVDALMADLVDRFTPDSVEGVELAWAGEAPFFAALNSQIGDDLKLAELIALPITLVLLVFVFRSLVAAAMPLVIGVMSILGTFLLLYVLGSITDVSIYAINLTTALGLGLGIDFSLFMVSRFREELRNGLDVDAAVERAVATAGRTIAFSGGTTMLSLSALVVFPLYFLRSFAYAGVGAVALATLAAIITLPALLATVGTRIDRLSFGRSTAHVDPDHGRLARLARVVMARPVGVATLVIAVLIAVGSPFLRAEFATPDHRVLPEGNAAREANELLRDEFAATETNAFGVVGLGISGTDDTAVDIAATLSGLEGVGRVDAASGTWVDGVRVGDPFGDPAGFDGAAGTFWSVVPDVEPSSTAGQDLVHTIRDLDVGAELLVGGGGAELVDTKAAIVDGLPYAVGLMLVATTVLMFLLLGSVLLPIKAVLLNLLSLTATFGSMVWIFQDGNLADLLGFTPTGAVDVTMPILMFCVAFGLSIDYEVFLVSRIREEYDLGADTETATARAIQRTGGILSASALLLTITFGAFAAGGTTFIKLFGLGLAIAVIVDAFFVRILLVPAVMKLAGEANWWAPSWLTRIHHKVEGTPAVPDSLAALLTDDAARREPAGHAS